MNENRIDTDTAGAYAASLSALAYYPSEPAARTLIADAIAEICATAEDATWLVKRALCLHETWSTCGVKGLWQIWFSKHRPRNKQEWAIDGIVGSSEVYPDGVPSERGAEQPLALPQPPKGVVSLDTQMDSLVKRLAAGKKLVED